MKIRNGFVSNSSSTSFCIFGVCCDSDTVKGVLLSFAEENKEKVWNWHVEQASKGLELKESFDKLVEEWEEYDIDDIVDVLYSAKVESVQHLSFNCDGGDGECYIGLGVKAMGKDETRAQFEQRVRKALHTLGIGGQKIGWINATIYG